MNRMIDKVREKYYTKPALGRAALLFLAVVVISNIFKPWTVQGYSYSQDVSETADVFFGFLPTSHLFNRVLFSISFVGLSDIMELMTNIVAKYNDVNNFSTGLMGCAAALISVQMLAVKSWMSCLYSMDRLTKTLYNYCVDNIIFSVSAYLLWFLYPVLHHLIEPYMDSPVMILVGFLLICVSSPFIFYFVAYFISFAFFLKALNWLCESYILNMNSFLQGIVLLILCCIASILINMLAEKVHTLLWIQISDRLPFSLPFVDDLDV